PRVTLTLHGVHHLRLAHTSKRVRASGQMLAQLLRVTQGWPSSDYYARRKEAFIPDAPRVIRDERGREVVRIQTPSGVVGYIATCITDDVLDAFIKKLRRKIARQKQRPDGTALKASPRRNA
ncbi:MAG: hypothetical protein L6Q69_20835, partial [Zoogloea sp.]|nr:hypothetical protein [Zoogloea sp.]